MSENEQEKRETLADVVAQIRAAAYIQNADTPKSVLRLADRLEAAWKRERGAVGNEAAMYAALVKIHDLTNALDENCGVDPVEIRDIARAAIAAPPRQCDVGTPDEQRERFRDMCEQEKCGRYRCKWSCKATFIDMCALAWAQTPYEAEEGAGK